MKGIQVGWIACSVLVCTGFVAWQVSVPDIEARGDAVFRGFDELERQGAYVVGDDGENLGRVAKGGLNALGNEFGMGSTFKSNGLFNTYGKHGSPYASTSAFNRLASDPPKIVIEKGGDLYSVGLLTTNTLATTKGQRINPYLLKAWLESK